MTSRVTQAFSPPTPESCQHNGILREKSFRQARLPFRQRLGRQMLRPRLRRSRSTELSSTLKKLFWRRETTPVPHKETHQDKVHNNKLVDSFAGSYKRIPKGYQPLFPGPIDPTASETSCTTHSSVEMLVPPFRNHHHNEQLNVTTTLT